MPCRPATRSPGRSPIRSASPVIAAVLALLWVAAAPAAARDRGADGKFEKRTSSHFVLYQDVDIDRSSGFHGSRRFEKQVLEVLERAYDELREQLDLAPRRRMEVVIHDPALFDVQFGGRFRFAAAGFYSGTIHVRGDTRVTNRLIRTLYHEVVHAAFDAAAPGLALPGWLNEGVAEWFEAQAIGKRGLSPWEHAALSEAERSGQLFTLWDLSFRSFGHLGPEPAQLAYLQSYAFIDYLARRHGDRSLRDLCRNLVRKRDLERAVERTYRAKLAELESRFATELRGG